MKLMKIISLGILVSLLAPFSTRAMGRQAGGAIGIGGGLLGLYFLYKWYYAEESNAQLCERAKKVHEKFEKHTAIALLYNGILSRQMTEEQLYELANHPDTSRLKGISLDFPFLDNEISKLNDRLKKEENEGGIVDQDLERHSAELISLRDALKKGADFWKTHAAFYQLYNEINEIAQHYNQVRGGLVADLFDYYTQRGGEKVFDKIGPNLKRDIQKLRQKTTPCKNYPVLFASAQSMIAELQSIQKGMVGVKAYLALEKEFQCYDDFARKLLYRDFQELPAKVKGVYAGKQEHPFDFVATEANNALSQLETKRAAVINCECLKNQEDPFSSRVSNLLEQVDTLGTFLVTLREQVVSLPEYDRDMKVKRKNKQRAEEHAQEEVRRKEDLRLEKEQAQREERIEQSKINLERDKASKKLEEARLLHEAKQKDKEIEELKLKQEKEQNSTASGTQVT